MEDGEQFDNAYFGFSSLCQAHSISIDTSPMTDSMDAVPVESILLFYCLNQFLGDQFSSQRRVTLCQGINIMDMIGCARHQHITAE